jgi:hypothetical protein
LTAYKKDVPAENIVPTPLGPNESPHLPESLFGTTITSYGLQAAAPGGRPGTGKPNPSPDGSVIARAVRGYPKGYNSLLLVPPSGGPPRESVRLKQPEGFTAAFAWSPDGKYVYFTRHTNSNTELMRIPAWGGDFAGYGRADSTHARSTGYGIAWPANVNDP